MKTEDYTTVNLEGQTPEPEGRRELRPECPTPTGSSDKEDRDPTGMNQHLKVDFLEVIAEPSTTHSFDRVWAWSHVAFEVCKLWSYRIISLLCAIPASILTGCLFSFVTCLHIWCLLPCVRVCLLCRPTCQEVCHSLMDIIVSPFCTSVGRCFRRVHLTVARY
ncbi:caveolin-2 isoform X1 [Stegostoma tigrinum]|uniref:caveolin-2 isoform X1 n=1 Tax=Stegostoma tigrinum TaxID=3053191 RepID=UPI00202B9533|nr:caveolin-2 isoform X1 [Stegostoma tigrinum]